MAVTLTIDLAAVRHNSAALGRRLALQGIDVVGVTKSVDGEPDVGAAMLAGGAVGLADSRLPSLSRLAARRLGPRLLIRPPQYDELDLALDVADVLLLSDLSTAARPVRARSRPARVHPHDRRPGRPPRRRTARRRRRTRRAARGAAGPDVIRHRRPVRLHLGAAAFA